MGFKLFSYGGYPSTERLVKEDVDGRKRSLKTRIIDFFKPKCLWVEENDGDKTLICSEQEEKDLNLRQWFLKLSEKDSPGGFPTSIARDDERFSSESRVGFSLERLLKIDGDGGGRLVISPVRRIESGKRQKRVSFRLPIDSIIIYSPELDLEASK